MQQGAPPQGQGFVRGVQLGGSCQTNPLFNALNSQNAPVAQPCMYPHGQPQSAPMAPGIYASTSPRLEPGLSFAMPQFDGNNLFNGSTCSTFQRAEQQWNAAYDRPQQVHGDAVRSATVKSETQTRFANQRAPVSSKACAAACAECDTQPILPKSENSTIVARSAQDAQHQPGWQG